MAIRNAQLFKELQEELDKRRSLFMHTTIALAAAVDAKDHYTRPHLPGYQLQPGDCQKMKESKNLDEKFMENLEIASLLHDIGKIGTPERVLNKTDTLTLGERNIVQKHPVDGVTILQAIKELEEALPGVKHHHERYDGSGYPDGLKGKRDPPDCRHNRGCRYLRRDDHRPPLPQGLEPRGRQFRAPALLWHPA